MDFSQLSNLVSMFKGGMNPESLVTMLASSDPEKLDMLHQAKQNPEAFIREEFRRRGMDLNEAMAFIKGVK